MKLRVVELLLVTTLPALFLASDGIPDLTISLATLIGGTLAAGAANAFNMVIESDIDRMMSRTSKRPIVNELISEERALVFAYLISLVSLIIFWIFTNPLATGLTVAAIAFYVFGYTVGLKRLFTGINRLVCGYGLPLLDCVLVLHGDIFLDPATFLGASY
jgi:protoheme IX farnesyltransferase